jgi:hypothetical protein
MKKLTRRRTYTLSRNLQYRFHQLSVWRPIEPTEQDYVQFPTVYVVTHGKRFRRFVIYEKAAAGTFCVLSIGPLL